MKKLLYVFAAVSTLVITSCQKRFEELQQNPNVSATAPPYLLLNKLLNDLSEGIREAKPWGAVARYSQFYCRNYQYYGDNQYNWSSGPFDIYTNTLKNIPQMELEAVRLANTEQTAYHAIGKFLRAYYFYNLTSLMGDVPMKDALKGTEVLQPKYDTQKDVFLQVLKWLDEANADFKILKDKKVSVQGDFFYDGDYDKWRKLVNAFKLRVLIALSKKEADTDLKIKQRFAEVMADPAQFPLFQAMEDNFSYKYIATINNYPTNTVNFGNDALRYNMAETYVKGCTDINDPRVLITCEPAWKLVNDNSWAPTDFRAYVASGTGENQDVMESKALSYSISLINRYRYYRTMAAEDFIIVGYPEMSFNIAEAINRGWISGNAEDWYKKGIEASQGFYGLKNGNNVAYYLGIGKSLKQNEWTTAIFSFDFATYYAQAGVKYETGAAGLTKIFKQKYLAFFQNSGWEPYFNYRRTGVPAFSTGVGIGNNGIIPKRWSYPSYEANRNKDNLKEALDRQFSGSNSINESIWLIK